MGKDKLTLWEAIAVDLGNIIGAGNPSSSGSIIFHLNFNTQYMGTLSLGCFESAVFTNHDSAW
jgi:hypothetical protein